MVDLTQVDLASEEDEDWGIVFWAKLFKAKTWEELKMISKKSDALREAAETLYVMNADQAIRERCRAREDYYRIQNTMNHKLEKISAEKEELAVQNQNLMLENQNLTSENQNLVSKVESLTSEIDAIKKLLSEHGM